MRRMGWLAVLLGLLLAGGARAKIVERVFELPVEVAGADGRAVRQPITVTLFRDEARARSPLLLLNHGRAPTAAERAALGRARFGDNARYFAALGYAVFAPTRVGYGVTGGPDVEDSGACGRKNFPPAYAAAVTQSLAVIAHAQAQPWVARGHGLVAGQSFGGIAALGVAARGVDGIVGAVNFAGGGGGRPRTHPEQPCRPERLAALLAEYGAAARVPTLWFYSANDRYLGSRHPRDWFAAFTAAGGKGRFVALPPFGEDGHPSFTRNPAAWRPAFEAWLRE